MDRITFLAEENENINNEIRISFEVDDMISFVEKVRSFALSLGYSEKTVNKFIINPNDYFSMITCEEKRNLNLEDLLREKFCK